MFGLAKRGFSGDFLLIWVQPSPAAMEKEAIPRVLRHSRRVCFVNINGTFHIVLTLLFYLSLVLGVTKQVENSCRGNIRVLLRNNGDSVVQESMERGNEFLTLRAA